MHIPSAAVREDPDLVRTVVIAVCCYATILSLPAVLGAFARSFGYTDQQIGFVGSAQLLGVTCGTFLVSNLLGAPLRRSLFLGAAAVAAGNAGAAFSSSLPWHLLSMWFVGVGAGIGGGFAYKVCGRSARAAQKIALVHVCQLAGGIVGYQVLKFALPAFGISKTLLGYACLAALVVWAARRVRVPGASTDEIPVRAWSLPPPAACWMLFGFWFYCCGEVGLWSFLERIGMSKSLAVADLSVSLSALSVAGIGACLIIAALPPHFPRRPVLGLALLFGLAAACGIFVANTLFQFTLSCAALGIFFFFTIPVLLGAVSDVDPTGRSTTLGLTVASTGQAVGPAIAGSLVNAGGYTGIGWFAATCFSVAILVALLVLHRQTIKDGEPQVIRES